MKITKTFPGVFLLAFLIGYVSAPPTEKHLVAARIVETAPQEIAFPISKPNAPLETIKDLENWQDEDKYPFKIKLLETGGSFHGEDIDAKNGENWLGLFKENGNYFLRSSKIKIRRVRDDLVDVKEKTGKSVDLTVPNKPIFLLKNAVKLREGKIMTFFQGQSWKDVSENSQLSPDEILTTLKKDFVQKYETGGKEYELKVVAAKNEKGEKILALVLEREGRRQVLHTMIAEANPDLGTLYWVGDLDRDGKPDFYIDLFVHENVGNLTLFLSSEADRDKLVKKVAYFWTTGC